MTKHGTLKVHKIHMIEYTWQIKGAVKWISLKLINATLTVVMSNRTTTMGGLTLVQNPKQLFFFQCYLMYMYLHLLIAIWHKSAIFHWHTVKKFCKGLFRTPFCHIPSEIRRNVKWNLGKFSTKMHLKIRVWNCNIFRIVYYSS